MGRALIQVTDNLLTGQETTQDDRGGREDGDHDPPGGQVRLGQRDRRDHRQRGRGQEGIGHGPGQPEHRPARFPGSPRPATPNGMAKKFGGTRGGRRAAPDLAWAMAVSVSVTMGSGERGPAPTGPSVAACHPPTPGKKGQLTHALFGPPE